MSIRTSLAFLVCLLLAPTADAFKQPAAANLLNVTDPQFDGGAIPDDGLDDWPAIKMAMGMYDGFDGNILYFPCGTYNFEDTLEWRDWPTVIAPGIPVSIFATSADGTVSGYLWTVGVPWMGEDRDCVTIKLKDNATGFDDPNNPKSFIKTGSLVGPQSNIKGLSGGAGGAGAYQNWFEDLTIDCGSGNPGVRCVDWIANNVGQLYRVKVKSGDGSGVAGVYMGRPWVGPCLLYQVEIQGFDYGIYYTQNQYSATFYKVTLKDQNVAGMLLASNAASIEQMTSEQTKPDVPAFLSTAGDGQLAMLYSTLSGVSDTRYAIETHAALKYVIAHVTTTGYKGALMQGTTPIEEGDDILQKTSHVPYKLFNAPDLFLDIPPDDPPEPFYSDPDEHPEDWANPVDYGAGPGNGGELNNDVVAIQAAMNSGKPIIYFPKATVRPNGQPAGANSTFSHIGPTITVPATVRRVIFNRTSMYIKASGYPSSTSCVYTVVGEATDPPVEFNYMRRIGENIRPAWYICNKSNGRKMILRNMNSSTAFLADGDNKSYILDVIFEAEVKNGAKVYAWQHNEERPIIGGGAGLIIDGPGTLMRTTGMKNEGDFVQAHVSNGAQFQMLMGWSFPCIGKSQQATPPTGVESTGFVIDNAQASLAFLQSCGKNPASPAYVFPVAVQQTIGQSTRQMTSLQMIYAVSCCSNRVYTPLFNAYPDTEIRVFPHLVDGPSILTLPQRLAGYTYEMTRIDPAGTTGAKLDPGMWTQPASCLGTSHATLMLNKIGDGTMDVDFYVCQETGNGVPVGLFDPAAVSTIQDPKHCVNATAEVTMDGEGPLPGDDDPDVFQYEGAMSKWVARLNDCNGDCTAEITVSCSPEAPAP